MKYCKCESEFMTTKLSDESMLHGEAVAVNNTILARIYTPAQIPGDLYSMCYALERGTVYPELDQPYLCKVDCCKPGADGEEISPETTLETPFGASCADGRARVDDDCGCVKKAKKEVVKHDVCR